MSAGELGPLSGLEGTWEGDKGTDQAPDDDRSQVETNKFRERMTFAPTGLVENHEQKLYGLRYATTAWRLGEDEPFHEELGYWLWDAGAKAIHVRPACPPLMFPCRFNLSTRSIHELAARKAIRHIEGHDRKDVSEYLDHQSPKYQQMTDWIAKDLGVTTLRYQTVEDMVKAIGLPKDKLCLYCWTGKCPKSACRRADIDIVETKTMVNVSRVRQHCHVAVLVVVKSHVRAVRAPDFAHSAYFIAYI